MGTNRELPGELPAAKNLHPIRPAVSQTHIPQSLLVHARTFIELVQRLQVYRQITNGKPGIVESPLWDATDERHLSAFEADADGTARTRGLSFATTPGGLAPTAGFTLAEPLPAVLGAGSGFKCV